MPEKLVWKEVLEVALVELLFEGLPCHQSPGSGGGSTP